MFIDNRKAGEEDDGNWGMQAMAKIVKEARARAREHREDDGEHPSVDDVIMFLSCHWDIVTEYLMMHNREEDFHKFWQFRLDAHLEHGHSDVEITEDDIRRATDDDD